MYKFLIAAGIVVVFVGGFFWFNNYIYDQKQGGVEDYRDVEFVMSGERVQLVDGEAWTETMMGGASASVVKYFGNEAKGDLNGDGVPDMAFLITQESGGSGTFFYVVGAVQNAAGRFQGTEAVLIGDRIAPQTTEIRDGQLLVNYADRAPGEPMAARPSVAKTLYLRLDPQSFQFGELVQNFEGESAGGR